MRPARPDRDGIPPTAIHDTMRLTALLTSPALLTLGLCTGASTTALAFDPGAPLKLGKTEIRTNVRDRSHDPQDELVYKSNGPVLDERHLQRNQTGRSDGKVHARLEPVGDAVYRLTLTSLDTGRLKSFRSNVGVVLPKQISCRFGYWTLGDTELESNTLTDSPDFPYYSAGTNEIDVVVDQASGRTFHFAGGELVIRFRVFEACAQ